MKQSLRGYRLIQKITWPKSYSAKFLLVAFIGIHIPLLTLTGYLLAVSSELNFFIPILIVTLMGTLGGTALTLWVITKLLKPLLISSDALQEYVDNNELQNLPSDFNDEAGSLMTNIDTVLRHMDELITLKDKLISVLAHDARTPLNSILAAQNLIELEIKKETSNRDVILEKCQIINMSAKQQQELMSNILNMARTNGGKINIEKEPVMVSSLFEEIYEANSLKIKAKEINFNSELNGLADQVINVDKAKLKGALNNLVDNAVKYTGHKGNITIGATVIDQQLKLYVEDDGLGIDLKNEPDLFEYGGTKSTSASNGKSEFGIGLWITKTFTELHGGTVTVESQKGQGSRFTLIFDAQDIISVNSETF